MVRPQAWQKGLANVAGQGGAKKKRILKDHALRLYPKLGKTVTLATADAVLIGHYHTTTKQKEIKKEFSQKLKIKKKSENTLFVEILDGHAKGTTVEIKFFTIDSVCLLILFTYPLYFISVSASSTVSSM